MIDALDSRAAYPAVARESDAAARAAGKAETREIMTRTEYLAALREKYPETDIQVGTGRGSFGIGGVVIHPALLDKMISDPEAAAKHEGAIAGISTGVAWLKSKFASDGVAMAACGSYMDEKGNMNTWGRIRTADASEKGGRSREGIEKRSPYSPRSSVLTRYEAGQELHQDPASGLLLDISS